MMGSLFDMYLRDSIMSTCEDNFQRYLEDEGEEYSFTEEERELMFSQIDHILDMIAKIYNEHEEEKDALGAMIDKLIGFCILSKMNETRLCKILNERGDKDGDV